MKVQGNKNQKRCFNKNTLDRIVVEERQEETIAKVSDWAKKEIDWYNSALLTLGPQQPPLDHHQGEIDPWDWLYICKLIRICNRGNWNGGEGGKRDGMGLIFQFISVECKSYAEIGTRVEGSPTNQQSFRYTYLQVGSGFIGGSYAEMDID